MTVLNIKARLLERIRSLQADIGFSQPPFDPLSIVAPLGVSVTLSEVSTSAPGGLLFRESSGYVIQVDSQSSEFTKRFRVAHEVSHIILDLVLMNQLDSTNVGAKRVSFNRSVERACDEGASEILMPLDMIKREVAGTPPSLIKLKYLTGLFKVSYQAAAIRAIRAGWRCIVLMSRTAKIDTQTPRLRVAWVVAPYRWAHIVKVGQLIPIDSIIHVTQVGSSKSPEELHVPGYQVTDEHSQILVRSEHLVFGNHRDLGFRPIQACKASGGTLALIPLCRKLT